MSADPVVLSLFIMVGLVFGTAGLIRSRTEAGRIAATTTGYFLAAWHLWVLVLGGWCLRGRPLEFLLCAALVVLLAQHSLLVVRSLREVPDAAPRPDSAASAPVRMEKHHAGVPHVGQEAYNGPYRLAAPLSAPMPAHQSQPWAGARHRQPDRDAERDEVGIPRFVEPGRWVPQPRHPQSAPGSVAPPDPRWDPRSDPRSDPQWIRPGRSWPARSEP